MQRARLIEEYRRGRERVAEAWAAVPAEARLARPASDEWSPHEIVIHLADGDANGYIRLRKLLAEPGGVIGVYDQPGWARALDYRAQDPERAIELIGVIRALTHPLLTRMSDDDWANTVIHPEQGEWSATRWLDVYTRHIDDHLAQMQRAVDVWRGA